MAEAELVDALEDTTEVVRTSIGTWDTEMDNVVDTCESESDNVLYSKVVPACIRVDTYATRDTNYDSEEDIEMILTSIGTDAFELYNTDLDVEHTAIVQTKSKLERDMGMVPAGIKVFQCEGEHKEHIGCEQDCTQSEHVTEL